MDRQTICIAGKNNIAIEICKYIRSIYHNLNVIAICNENDIGKNGFQASFRRYCLNEGVEITTLKDVYKIKDLIFLSLEFDKIIVVDDFLTRELYNIHFSLLPAYKGMYTSALPILKGEQFTGVTLHKIDAGIDTGDIISQEVIGISNSLKSWQLYLLYIEAGIIVVRRHLQEIIDNKCRPVKQSNIGSTYFSKNTIDYKNLKIDLKVTAFQLLRQINAFVFPAYQLPVVSGYEIYDAEISDVRSMKSAGTIVKDIDFYFDVTTIDYDVRMYKNRINALIESAKVGKIEILKNFINHSYDIHQRTIEGWDVAIVAAYHSQFDYLDFLLDELNWDINTCNYNGTTLAMYLMTVASNENNLVYFKEFLKREELDLSLKDYSDTDIKNYAKKYGNVNVISLLAAV